MPIEESSSARPVGAAESKTYLPQYLTHHFGLLAALEDNPVFLREMAYRHAPRRLSSFMLELMVYFVLPLLLMYLALISFGYLAMVLVFLFFASIRSPFGRLQTVNRLARFLEEEWRLGRLGPLCITGMRGQEIVWGYAGTVAWRNLVRFFYLTLAGTLVLLLFIPTDYYIDIRFASADEVLPYLIGIVAMASQLALLTIASILFTSVIQVRYLAQNLVRRMGSTLAHSLLNSLFISIGFFPGLLAGIYFVMQLHLRGAPRHDYLFSLTTTTSTATILTAFFLSYALVNLPICCLLLLGAASHFRKRIDCLFNDSVRSLGENTEQPNAPRSQIFGQ